MSKKVTRSGDEYLHMKGNLENKTLDDTDIQNLVDEIYVGRKSVRSTVANTKFVLKFYFEPLLRIFFCNKKIKRF